VITIPAPPWELLGGLLAGLAALLTALFGGMKVFAEIRDLRQQADKTARDTAEVLSQQYTNGGSSLRDDIKRVLNISKQNAEMILVITEAQKRQDAEIGRFNRHTILLNERITSEMSRAASRLDDFSERIRRVENAR
jgi:hypothetical protein